MRALLAFTKKEAMEQVRSGKALVLALLFALLGIMNPAVAKLTPWLLEIMADALAQSGMTVTAVTVTAMDSWVQFFKNMPIGLIVFLLLQSNVFTKEYGSGTLVLSLTKGLQRFKVILSKAALLTLLWTVGYWLSFGITYAYNTYFWDNAIARHLFFSALCWWAFGMLAISLMILFSTLTGTNTGVLLGTGGVLLASYLLGLLPKISKYVPTLLADGNSLIYGLEAPKAYAAALIIAALASIACLAASIPILNKKQL